jgi:hypothetical protein
MILNSMILIAIGFWIGILYSKWSNKISEKIAHNKLVLDRNKQFKQILEKVNTKRSRFKNRVNNTVFIGVKLEDFGKVDVVLFLDKNDISIFKNEKCIMTSDLVEKELLNQVAESIYKVHFHRIEDVVQVLGLTFSRQDFEKSFGISVEELKQRTEGLMRSMNGEESDIDKIIKKNSKKLDINDILDRINEVGIENLTVEEKEFLKNYKND